MFKIIDGKGYHITFENGWTVSVQFGPGNYCSNYDKPLDTRRECGENGSLTAEAWAWNKNTNYPADPIGYKTSAEILAYMNKVANFDPVP